jgi:phosphoserine phosphatase RsbU/P
MGFTGSAVVLVVDDDEASRALARATLEDDYRVLLAPDGETGVAMFVRDRPHCILLDVEMPGMDGIAACRNIRELPGGADVVIVFLTVHHDVELFDRAIAAGADDFITKPYRPSELLVRVNTACKLRRIAEERSELYAMTSHQRAELRRIELQMREANEHLVVQSVRAEQLAERAHAIQEARNASEERFRTLVTTSSALVWQANADGRVCVDPEAWRKLTGLDDRERVHEAWTTAVATGSPYHCQHRMLRKEGGYAWVMAHAARIPSSGVVREWIGMLTDVSDRVRVEEARERFIGILGHDLRNPLNAIMMGVELLDELPPAQTKVVKSIARSAHRMEAMIRDLLDFARGRLAGGIPILPRSCNLGEVCRHVVDELKLAYPMRDIAFAATGVLDGNWDPDRVEQVVSNLLGNAVTHGDGQIHVSARDEGHRVLLTIHNRGLPIPKAALATLFDPFVTGRDSRSLGLGLYIASEIVHAHHGSIEVSSEAGAGTTFDVAWPR